MFRESDDVSENRQNAFNVFPDLNTDDGYYRYLRMICHLASNGNYKIKNYFFFKKNFQEVYDEFVESLAAKLDG